ncbi:ABC transporter ATP-binding protein [Pseudonocardia alni]|uniref:ABC transporter ATP-binding protein n=1 Tax=Pseudonocardia alni TaxID=33907 RepID=UPI001AD6399B|nr:ABC transporter ATP-binding protein [Pseudonocardia alni]MBO4239565.1 ATP-binding cassette domain-containing protein [Pseudonocardia alni]
MRTGLSVRGVRAGYGRDPVLHGIDLDVAPGELVSVLGASGSGKTTLLRVVAGLHRPSAGTVHLDGDDVTAVAPERRRVGLVPQEGALFAHLTVAGNVGFGLRRGPGRRPAAAARGRVAELLALVGLTAEADRLPHALSGGERRRVALARALAPDPRVVLLDEPFSALDAGLREQVRGEVVAALRTADATGVLITHDRREALAVSDRVAVLHDGRLEQTASPRELYAAPASARVAGFVGDAVLLPARVEDGTVTTALGAAPCRTADVPAAPLVAVLRPEELELAGTDGPGAPARVGTVDFVGDAVLVTVLLDGRVPDRGTLLRVRAGTDRVPHPGDRCRVRSRGAVHVVPAVPGPR